MATSYPSRSCLSVSGLAALSTAQLARMAIVDPIDEGDVGALSREVAEGIGGIILLGSDASPTLGEQISALMRLAPRGRAPFVMVDEEGGSVQRLRGVVGDIPSARTMGSTMSPVEIEHLAFRLGRKMRSLGVTMDLAPVLDLDAGAGPNLTDADGTRSFSVNASVTSTDALAFAEGLLASHVLPVLKHFPGLGGATGNTDLGRASTRPYAGPDGAPLEPFLVALHAGMPAVMIANAQVPGLTSKPASLSGAVITTLLRRELAFRGLILTDSLSAESIPLSGYPLAQAAVAALRAGADEVLFNALPSMVASDNAAVANAVVDAVFHHKLSRVRLIEAASHSEAAKAKVSAC